MGFDPFPVLAAWPLASVSNTRSREQIGFGCNRSCSLKLLARPEPWPAQQMRRSVSEYTPDLRHGCTMTKLFG